MANHDPVINPNPNIAEAGKATQFQPGNKEQLKGTPWSVRKTIRSIGSRLGELPSKEERKKMSSLERGAIRMLEKFEEGDARCAEIVIDNVDGKVVQPNLNADLARVSDMSDEEINDEITRIEQHLAALNTANAEEGTTEEGDGEERPATEA